MSAGVTNSPGRCWKPLERQKRKPQPPASGGLLPVETQSPTQLVYKLAGFYLRWNLSILKSNIIAEIPLLFKLIYFLMVYLHIGICILFHSKCYNSTCPILDKTPKLREKIETVKEENEYKKGLTPPSLLGNTGPSSRERTWRILVFSTLITSVLAFCFSLLSLFLCCCSSIKVISTGDAEPHKVHCEGIFILRNVKDMWGVTSRRLMSY